MKKFLLCFCIIINSIQLRAQCLVGVNTVTDASCLNNNGAVELTFSGAVAPYFINFNTLNLGSPGSSITIPDLYAGTYGISVTDQNGTLCTGAANVTVANLGIPSSLSLTGNNPSCFTCANGSVTSIVSGGSAPYTYFWNTTASTPSLQNLLPGTYTLVVTNADGCITIDTVSLTAMGINYHLIEGTVFYDINQNGIYDAGDAPLSQQQVQIQPSGLIAYTNNSGEYIFGDTIGNYTVNFLPTNTFQISSGPSSHNVNLIGTDTTGLNFALSPDSLFHGFDGTVLCPMPRCNRPQPFYLHATNTGTYTDSIVTTFSFSANLTYLSSSPVGTVNGNTITFETGGVYTGQTIDYQVTFLLPGFGNMMNTEMIIQAYDSSGTPVYIDSTSYNIGTLCGFDPNDKSVYPEGTGTNHEVPLNQELQYLIRFQNTGNDTAFAITVEDTLDSNLDPASLRLLSSSHDCIIERSSGNIVRFIFNNILLPDSTIDEAGSHGYALFGIAPNSNMPDPSIVENTAYIFFDYNPPIVTNTTSTTFTSTILNLDDIDVELSTLFPNPIHGNTFLSFEKKDNHSLSISISDISGQVVWVEKNVSGNGIFLSAETLTSGMYLVRIFDQDTNRVKYGKLVVQN